MKTKPNSELLIKNEKLGLPISEELSVKCRKYVNKLDIAEASARTGVGTSTIRQVLYGQHNLTADNSRGLAALIENAIQNGMQLITDASVDVAYFKSITKN